MRESGMKRVLRLRDGDSERGSVMQEGTRDWIGRDTNEKGATAGAQPDRRGEGFY